MTHPHLEGLNKLADDMNEWLCDPFVNLTPMRHMDVENFIGRLRTIATQALAALPGGGVDDNVANLVSCSAAILHLLDGGLTPYAVKEDLRAALVPFLPTPNPHEADQ